VLAHRRVRDVATDGVAVIAMHGATNIGHYLQRFGPAQLNLTLAVLCDRAEQNYFRRAFAPSRFINGRSGNKHRYARLLAQALELSRVPRRLDRVLAHVESSTADEREHPQRTSAAAASGRPGSAIPGGRGGLREMPGSWCAI
jgi:hypothetical protein